MFFIDMLHAMPCSEFTQGTQKRDQTVRHEHHDQLVCKGPAMEYKDRHKKTLGQ